MKFFLLILTLACLFQFWMLKNSGASLEASLHSTLKETAYLANVYAEELEREPCIETDETICIEY